MAAWTYDDLAPRQPRRGAAGRALAVGLSLAAHGAILLLILTSARTTVAMAPVIAAVPVELIRPPAPAPAPSPAAAPAPARSSAKSKAPT
ncbi:MAG: hypothetical protein ACREEB_02055, partial [Caulobacteraceae bacterium]